MNVLDEKPSKALETFLDDYIKLFPYLDKNQAFQKIKEPQEFFNELTTLWYDHLDAGNLDKAYEVYNHDYYVSDIWNCWQLYSRRYLRNIRDNRILNKNVNTFLELTQDAKVVVDLGCGLGQSTAALTQLYPYAIVFATNLRNTKQWKYLDAYMTKRYGFYLKEDVDKINYQADIIFASEYFEHFERPTEHMKYVFNHIKPRYLVLANAFNTWSIGHFRMYYHGHQKIHESKISDVFNNYLKGLGYEKIKTDYFNDRPTVWELKEEPSVFDF